MGNVVPFRLRSQPAEACRLQLSEAHRQRSMVSLAKIIADLEHVGREEPNHRPQNLIETAQVLCQAIDAIDFNATSAPDRLYEFSQQVLALGRAVQEWRSTLPLRRSDG